MASLSLIRFVRLFSSPFRLVPVLSIKRFKRDPMSLRCKKRYVRHTAENQTSFRSPTLRTFLRTSHDEALSSGTKAVPTDPPATVVQGPPTTRLQQLYWINATPMETNIAEADHARSAFKILESSIFTGQNRLLSGRSRRGSGHHGQPASLRAQHLRHGSRGGKLRADG